MNMDSESPFRIRAESHLFVAIPGAIFPAEENLAGRAGSQDSSQDSSDAISRTAGVRELLTAGCYRRRQDATMHGGLLDKRRPFRRWQILLTMSCPADPGSD